MRKQKSLTEEQIQVCMLGLTAFSKIFDFVKNVWFPITQQKKSIKGLSIFYYIKLFCK